MSLLSALEKEFRNNGIAVENLGGRKKNIVAVETASNKTLLYVKISNLSNGFWGLNENQLNQIQETKLPWSVVLLTGSIHAGFLLPSSYIVNAIKNNTWSFSKTDYKVHEHDLDVTFKFTSFSKLMQLIK